MLQHALDSFAGIKGVEILAFIIPFLLAIWIDLRAHRASHAITMRDAAMWSVIWVLCAMAFGAFIYFERGGEAASLYVTGYVLEKALAVDNLFAFFLIFKSFGLTQEQNQPLQHRILYWGILGAIVFRVLFLGIGAMVVNLSPYVLIAFALIVLWTVYKMWQSDDDDEEVDYTKHWSVALVKRFTRVNPSIESKRFFSNGATPLFLCLICIEVCDVIFAFDSMPVIVAVVKDPFLMITSSLWAAAGLRSLYFLLIAAQNKFWALEKAVMLLLVFVSGKLIGSAFLYHLPNAVSLSIVGVILATGIIWSLVYPIKEEPGKKP
ncbi:TerC/Alx family metal homeostasis membrane protein [Luteolibacter flavescens]|uniref:TerC/Alx family metal homeostasis membrane protein n=1 Tax=Luteolibacter flavescens TaxID=1859460 RepID=A0ABT3FVN7_9BACT|nr:TerC/Alx family metal homeostasis membrane protein [Luteolibacter flavescens]MCW1887035.1 TerC/Alx family metal homeostasis membrane protein [Luteolibacter flavescens]